MSNRILQDGDDCLAFLWTGDRTLDTILALLQQRGVHTARHQACLLASGVRDSALISQFEAIIAAPIQDDMELASMVGNKMREKYDRYLSDDLLSQDYASRDLDVEGARRVLRRVLEGLSPTSD